MDDQLLENEVLTVEILTKGAEVKSIKSKLDGTEYIWQADANYWGRHAPILFPIVGKLKNDQYYLAGKKYMMAQHGFARDRDFYVKEKTDNHLSMTLRADETSLQNYPFNFELTIDYKLIENSVIVNYLVKNLDDEQVMHFAIGAHPGFNLPLDNQTDFSDYYFELSPKKARKYIPVTEEVLLQTDQAKEVEETIYPVTRELFKDGVLIWETPGSTRLNLKSDKTDKEIVFDYNNMPYLGLWSTYPLEAPFVCIEPWCGIADPFDSNGKYEEKLGINQLKPKQEFQSSYQMTFK